MNKLTKSLAVLAAAVTWQSAAAVGGYPVVLVHGFQPQNLADKPTGATVTQNGANYWSEYWAARADVRIDWPSQERIAGKISSDYIWPKLQQMSQSQLCKNGCIFVTHSTGDLVTRYIIDNQALWLRNVGLSPLNIVATFDFSGAGGGSELADLAVNVATGGGLIDLTLRAALSLWLGELPNANNVGVLNDLRVNSARQLAKAPTSRVPRLRYIGSKSDFLNATSPFLPGNDDGVVAPHSSCGAASAASFDSCSKTIATDGKITSQAGVSSFMPYHYPLLMSAAYSHSGTISNQVKGEVTAANASAAYLNNKAIRFNTFDEKRGWWVFSSTYRVVSGSSNSSMSDLVFKAAN